MENEKFWSIKEKLRIKNDKKHKIIKTTFFPAVIKKSDKKNIA